MKDNKGFTLIELIAVVVILAVIMTLAIPNIVSTINRNKKETFIEDAKKFQASAEYMIINDRSLQLPSTTSALILTLEEVDKSALEVSPYSTNYSKTKSYVVVTKESKSIDVDDGTGRKNKNLNEYTFYVHLVTCTKDNCVGDDVNKRYGINLQRVDTLVDNNRYEAVVQAAEVDVLGLDNDDAKANILEVIGNKTLVIPSTNTN